MWIICHVGRWLDAIWRSVREAKTKSCYILFCISLQLSKQQYVFPKMGTLFILFFLNRLHIERNKVSVSETSFFSCSLEVSYSIALHCKTLCNRLNSSILEFNQTLYEFAFLCIYCKPLNKGGKNSLYEYYVILVYISHLSVRGVLNEKSFVSHFNRKMSFSQVSFITWDWTTGCCLLNSIVSHFLPPPRSLCFLPAFAC